MPAPTPALDAFLDARRHRQQAELDTVASDRADAEPLWDRYAPAEAPPANENDSWLDRMGAEYAGAYKPPTLAERLAAITDSSRSGLSRASAALDLGNTGVANPLADRIGMRLTEPREGQSPTMAMLRGLGAGMLHGASNVMTAPLALLGEAVPAYRGLKGLLAGGRGAEAGVGTGARAAAEVTDLGNVENALPLAAPKQLTAGAPEPTIPSAPAAVRTPESPAPGAYAGAERRLTPRPAITDPAEDAAYQTMRDKLARGERTGTPAMRAMFAEKQRVEDARKAAAATRGELDTRAIEPALMESDSALAPPATAAPTPKPKLTAPEVRAMLDKRTGLKDSLASAGKTPPPGSFDTADALGIQYRRAKDLGTDDLRALGKQLKQHERGLLKDETGKIATPLLSKLTGATVGGLTGGAAGDTPTEKLEYGLLGAVAGGALGARFGSHLEGGLARATQAGEEATGLATRAREGVRALGNTTADLQRTSLLSGRAPLKAGLGSIGAIPYSVLDELVTKGPAAAGRMIAGGIQGAKNAPAMMRDAALGRTPPQGLVGKEYTNSGLLAIPNRLMSIPDAGAKAVLQGMGRDEQYINDALLTGTPMTESGQNLVKAADAHPVIKNLSVPVGLKTGIKMLEQGARHLGGGERYGNSDLRTRLGRLGLGLGATAAGTQIPDEWRTPATRGLLIAAGGPLGVPVALGEAVTSPAAEAITDRAQSALSSLFRESSLPRNAANLPEVEKRFEFQGLRRMLGLLDDPPEPGSGSSANAASRTRRTRTGRTRASRSR